MDGGLCGGAGGMKEPLISNEQADRWLVRSYIKPEAERVAAAVWWGRLTIEDAAQELRGIAYLKATSAKVAPELADAVAISALDEAMQSHEAEHAVRDGLGARVDADDRSPVPGRAGRVHDVPLFVDRAGFGFGFHFGFGFGCDVHVIFRFGSN